PLLEPQRPLPPRIATSLLPSAVSASASERAAAEAGVRPTAPLPRLMHKGSRRTRARRRAMNGATGSTGEYDDDNGAAPTGVMDVRRLECILRLWHKHS